MTIVHPEKFYDEISFFYDDMINFNNSLEKRKILLTNFIEDYHKDAADLGCGSGLDAIALSSLGLDVTAFDPSVLMLKKAKENAARNNKKIVFINSGIEKIPIKYKQKFDIVFSLGNTIANISPSQISKAFGNIFMMLKTGGKFVLQILNYSRILKRKEKIVGIQNKDGFTFIRFYDFHHNFLNFNILRFNRANPEERLLSSTKIIPYNSTFIVSILRNQGFKKIKCFGSLSLHKFQKSESKDLLISAKKD